MSSVRNQRLHELVDKALDNTIGTLGGAKEFGRCFAVDRDAQDCLEACYDDAIASFRTNAKVGRPARRSARSNGRRGARARCRRSHAYCLTRALRLPALPHPLCAQAEIRATLYETKLSDDLHRLDALIAQQPQLHDGSRWCARGARARIRSLVSRACRAARPTALVRPTHLASPRLSALRVRVVPGSLPPARVDPAKAVAAVAAEQRSVHKRKLEKLLRELEAENALMRSTVAESRAHIESTSSRVKALYDPSAAQSAQCC